MEVRSGSSLADGLDMLPNLDPPDEDDAGVPVVEPRTLTDADVKTLLYTGAPADGNGAAELPLCSRLSLFLNFLSYA